VVRNPNGNPRKGAPFPRYRGIRVRGGIAVIELVNQLKRKVSRDGGAGRVVGRGVQGVLGDGYVHFRREFFITSGSSVRVAE